MQERREPTPEVVREEILHAKRLREHQKCEVTMLREDKNTNGKRNLETQITRKKAKNLSKKKKKLERLQEGSSEDFAERRLAEIEPRRNSRTTQKRNSTWRSYMIVGGVLTIRMTLQNG
jgi:hypothetical protein